MQDIRDKIYLINGLEMRNGRRWYGENHERQRAWEHYRDYRDLAEKIGVEQLKRIVPFDKETILKSLAYEREHNEQGMNAFMPLEKWDNCDSTVRRMLSGTGIKSWSLCETVCVLKHVARYHIAMDQIPKEV